jgi:hypothetical protein
MSIFFTDHDDSNQECLLLVECKCWNNIPWQGSSSSTQVWSVTTFSFNCRACVCVCVHACVCERGRERELNKQFFGAIKWIQGHRIQDRAIGIEMGYKLDRQGLIHGMGKRFFSTPQCPASYPMATGAHSQGVKWPGINCQHSHLVLRVCIEWCLNIEHRSNFTFFFNYSRSTVILNTGSVCELVNGSVEV